jgi:hypothetical protein
MKIKSIDTAILINGGHECDFENLDGHLIAKLDGEKFAQAFRQDDIGRWDIYFFPKALQKNRSAFIYGNVNSAKKAINQMANFIDFLS